MNLRLRSADFTGADSVEAFREVYGRAIMRLEIDPSPDHPLEVDFTIKAVPGFSFATGTMSPTVNRHPPSLIDSDDIVLVYAPEGCGTISQMGRETQIAGGAATFASDAEAGVFQGHSPAKLYNFRFTRKMLSGMLVDIDAAIARPIVPGNTALWLLTRYASVMSDLDALATPALRSTIVTHMHDLAALLLGPGPDGIHVAGRRGVRAAQLRAIQQDIKRNLTSRDLTPESVARRHAVSARTLRDMFKNEATTFTDYVLEQRLALAHRMLCSRLYDHLTISAIAFDSGFGDISYFNHAFRRRYGATPSDTRNAVPRADDVPG